MVEHPETPLDEMLEERDRFDKAILLGIVITSLLAALTALGQIHALQRHDESVAQADQWSSMASQASFTSNSIAQLQLDRFRLSQDASARSHQARTAYFLNAGPSLRDSYAQFGAWRDVASTVQTSSSALATARGGFGGPAGELGEIAQMSQASMPDIAPDYSAKDLRCRGLGSLPGDETVPGAVTVNGPDGPGNDSSFPTKYLADSRRQAYILQGEGVLASQHAEREELQFTRLAVSLTGFATAVFLFGFALSPYGRSHRHLFSTGAAIFVVSAAAWAAYAEIRSPANEDSQVAIAYADGRVAGDKADYADTKVAIKLDRCAIAHDKDFAPAYTALAIEENSLTDPRDPTGGTNTELVGAKGALHEAESALDTADGLGVKDPSLDEIAGADKFEDGLRTHNRDEMREGLRLEQAAAQMLFGPHGIATPVAAGTKEDPPVDPGHSKRAAAAALLIDSSNVAFNIAEAQLALGQLTTATSSYRRAVGLARSQMAASGWPAQIYVSSALTDLTDVYNNMPALRSWIRSEEPLIVAGLYGRDASRATGAAPVNTDARLALTVLPTLAEFRLTGGSDLHGTVNAQWYYRPASGDPWSAFTGPPSGPIQLQRGPGHSYVGFGTFSPSYLVNPVCLGSGDYRLELYTNRRLVASTWRHISLASSSPAEVPDMSVSLCRPSSTEQDWKVNVRVAGLMDGYMRSDGRAGLFVFDVSPESYKQIGVPGQLDGMLGHVLHQVRQALPPHRLHVVESPRDPLLGVPDSFLGQAQDRPVEYSYPGGRVVAGIATDPFGSRAVAIVAYGPTRLLRGDSNGVPETENLLGSAVFN